MSEELEKKLEGLRQSALKLGIKPPDIKSPQEKALDERLKGHEQVARVSGPQAPPDEVAKRTWDG
mgnify:CR=1 FL=1